LAARYITIEEFEEYRKANSAYLDDLNRRVNGIEQSNSNTSVRLSRIETQLSVVETEVKSLRSEMQTGFAQLNAKMDIQYNELHHMMSFLITHLGFTLPEQPEQQTEQPEGDHA
jgi:predicted  nucleic acid-binding Zn-ribbon protein